MSSLMAEIAQRAFAMGVPLSAQMDLTYRCNERCVHCYLPHHDAGELTTAEISRVFRELADAGTLFLTLSGGEPLVRKDFFEIVAFARSLQFNVKLKTNGILIGAREATRLRALGVEKVQISIYSHLAEVHDAITRVKGSFARSIRAIGFLKEQGLKIAIATILMKQNRDDYRQVLALARRLDVTCTLDPTITPFIDGDPSLLRLRISVSSLREVMLDQDLASGNEPVAVDEPPDDAMLDGAPCSAGHTSIYISPYGDVFPCVQFPLPTGNIRQRSFAEIWNKSPDLLAVRSIRLRDLPICSSCVHSGSCTRCPGLAYMEGDMRGPSSADCEKSFARTGRFSSNMLRKMPPQAALVQIQDRTADGCPPQPKFSPLLGPSYRKEMR
jgi:radical SAM protein with 4Fe4S-binding SPASM domain